MKTLKSKFGNKQIVAFASALVISLHVAFAGSLTPANLVKQNECNYLAENLTNATEYYDLNNLLYSIYETTKEDNIAIESWMTDLSSFRNSDQVIFEEDIPLEDWMIDLSEQNWNNINTIEERISLEPWMLDLNYWKPATR